FTPAQAGLDYQDLWIETPDGARLHGWLVVAAPAAPLLVFCHGNAGNIGDRVANVALLVRAGISVLTFDYRGYGRSSGKPTEEGVYLDGRTVYDYAVGSLAYRPRDVVLFGRSLGAAVAAHLASRVEVAGVILESAFTNLKDLAWVHYPFIPGKFLVKRKFNVVEMVKKVKAPLLVIHGDRDSLVPLRMGERVYKQAPGPKEFYVIPGADHNDTELVGGETYIRRLRSFVYRVTGREG
ncbi:MAG: alpha/beta hydrolase, partial [Aquificota bacterium]